MNQFTIGQYYDPSFERITEKERMDNLESVAYETLELNYTKTLSESELQEKKEDYSLVRIDISEIEKAKKEYLEGYKEKVKPLISVSNNLLEAIKYKSEQTFGKVFLIDDQENNTMYVFDAKGICIEARPLAKSEKQLKLRKINQL